MYPSTEKEVLRYHVFKDLWEKGFFLTSGVKFGGDFLVYPGNLVGFFLFPSFLIMRKTVSAAHF